MPTGLSAEVDYHVVNSLGWPDLRPLQRAAVDPVRAGADCLLLAPTAGGKTEAAVFPLLSEMAEGEWTGLSVLYVTPLRALLNNLQPRLAGYTSWIGRRAELWHGDVGPTQRRNLIAAPPDLLLTTPESLEAILVSTKVDPHRLFANLRVVVIDDSTRSLGTIAVGTCSLSSSGSNDWQDAGCSASGCQPRSGTPMSCWDGWPGEPLRSDPRSSPLVSPLMGRG